MRDVRGRGASGRQTAPLTRRDRSCRPLCVVICPPYYPCSSLPHKHFTRAPDAPTTLITQSITNYRPADSERRHTPARAAPVSNTLTRQPRCGADCPIPCSTGLSGLILYQAGEKQGWIKDSVPCDGWVPRTVPVPIVTAMVSMETGVQAWRVDGREQELGEGALPTDRHVVGKSKAAGGVSVIAMETASTPQRPRIAMATGNTHLGDLAPSTVLSVTLTAEVIEHLRSFSLLQKSVLSRLELVNVCSELHRQQL
ncbi:hypothetical protein Bbelb_203210 [Branchiostoma belcheri]|nr:hypothetical protein Bbelb_203210 [Branchiostoma belcheri]